MEKEIKTGTSYLSKKDGALNMVQVRLAKDRTYISDKPIETSQDAVKVIVNELKDLDRECFVILNLTAKGMPINANIVSTGSLTETIIHPREVFKSSILSSAAAIIVMHNHPSGSLEPSNADIESTERLRYCGKLLNIYVVDHIIFNPEGICKSLREEGYIQDDVSLDDSVLRELLNHNDFDYKRDMVAEDNVVTEPTSEFTIYREIDGKKVEIQLTKDELWQAHQEEIMQNNVQYITDDLIERGEHWDTSVVYGMSVDSILKNEQLIYEIAAEYEDEITQVTADDEILDRTYRKVISGYLFSEAERNEKSIGEQIDNLSASHRNDEKQADSFEL